jgi:hypothetical protein
MDCFFSFGRKSTEIDFTTHSSQKEDSIGLAKQVLAFTVDTLIVDISIVDVSTIIEQIYNL